MSTGHSDSAAAPPSAGPVQFRLVTRYASRSAEAAEDNQRRVEAVFAELDRPRPAVGPRADQAQRAGRHMVVTTGPPPG